MAVNTMKTYTKAVTTTASKIESATGLANSRRTLLAIHSPAGAAATVYLGDDGVDATNGIPLAAGERVVFTNDGGGAHASLPWFGYAASSVTLQVTEAY